MRTRTTVAVGLAALAAAGAAGAAPKPNPEPAALQTAERLVGVHVRARPRLVVVSPRTLRAKAAALANRDSPPAVRAYDTELYRALGLPAGERLPPAGPPSAAVYDRARRTVYVERGAPKAAAVAGLVRALQGEAFGRRTPARGRDATLARDGAAEGVAELVAPHVRRKPGSRPATPIARFLAVERGLARDGAVRFARILDAVGGRTVAQTSLREPPATTEQVLHVDKYLEREPALPVRLPAAAAGLALTGSDTFGELDVRALLAGFRVPRASAVAAGWGGGRSALYRGPAGEAVALRLDWDDPADAGQWAAAVPAYVAAAFAGASPANCDGARCWTAGDRAVGFAANGARTALAFAPDAATAASLAQTLLG